jgi:aminoglycoside 3-N-acetyltransferase
MLTFGDFKSALGGLELDNRSAIVHASLRSFGAIQGGSETVVQVLLSSLSGLLVPTFTYRTMITPEVGPPNNGLTYGRHRDPNRMAEPFRADMPADPLMGVLPETMRHFPGARRSAHPILSFAGISMGNALHAQTILDPFAPVGVLGDQEGWILLLGVDHTVNTSIHYAEKLAGRHQFVRWALARNRVVECRGFPGCSDGFEAIRPQLEPYVRRVQLGNSFIEAVPLKSLFAEVQASLKANPLALLCQREDCQRCYAVRDAIVGVG